MVFLLPGYNYNYRNYSLANYLRNNFVDHGTPFAKLLLALPELRTKLAAGFCVSETLLEEDFPLRGSRAGYPLIALPLKRSPTWRALVKGSQTGSWASTFHPCWATLELALRNLFLPLFFFFFSRGKPRSSFPRCLGTYHGKPPKTTRNSCPLSNARKP